MAAVSEGEGAGVGGAAVVAGEGDAAVHPAIKVRRAKWIRRMKGLRVSLSNQTREMVQGEGGMLNAEC